MRKLLHNRVELALHTLREGDGRPLLLLHGLGERTPAQPPRGTEAWAGPVLGLDLTGHGDSTVPTGGGYTAELLMADVDVALAEIGPATLLGRGLGAYVALLLAGARPEVVRGAILDDGPGLLGGASGPTSAHVLVAPPARGGPPDPYALLELSTDVRTADYASVYARHAAERSGLPHPIAVVARARPPWLVGVLDSLLLARTTLEQAIASFAAA
jgi:pimeloyl-ACP methyl ester carboxylesterase